jgi:hypothetical protein
MEPCDRRAPPGVVPIIALARSTASYNRAMQGAYRASMSCARPE